MELSVGFGEFSPLHCESNTLPGKIKKLKGDGVRRLNRLLARTDDPYSIDASGRVFFMIGRLFRNRWYRVYFQFLEAFAEPRCPLCILVSRVEDSLWTALFRPDDRRKEIKVPLRAMCAAHKARVKSIVATDPRLICVLKTALKDSLQELTLSRRDSKSPWRRWIDPFPPGCSLCTRLFVEERTLCRALVRFLKDTEFWKAFAKAPLLCWYHLEKCQAIADDSVESMRLVTDQSTKLNNLLNDLIRWESTGSHEESKRVVLDWLADSSTPTFNPGKPEPFLTEDDFPPNLANENHLSSSSADTLPNREALFFETQKLKWKVQTLLDRLNEVESRSASLHYQVSRLSEDNKRLAMGYTGANAQAEGLKQLVQDLRREIARMRSGNRESKSMAPKSTG